MQRRMQTTTERVRSNILPIFSKRHKGMKKYHFCEQIEGKVNRRVSR